MWGCNVYKLRLQGDWEGRCFTRLKDWLFAAGLTPGEGFQALKRGALRCGSGGTRANTPRLSASQRREFAVAAAAERPATASSRRSGGGSRAAPSSRRGAGLSRASWALALRGVDPLLTLAQADELFNLVDTNRASLSGVSSRCCMCC